jgi:hypothetical protein
MKKIKIEFYFILYLAAIATLFAIASQRDKVSVILTEMLKDGGSPQLQISIPLIRDFNISENYNGRFNDPVFIKNKEKIRNASLKINKIFKDNIEIQNAPEFISKVFRVIDSTSIRFNDWMPDDNDTGSYSVSFMAMGIPQRSARIDSLLNELPDDNLKFQFKDTVTFADLKFRIINRFNRNEITNGKMPQFITLSIPENEVKAIIIQGTSEKGNILLGWKQRLFIGGIKSPNMNDIKIISDESNIKISGTDDANIFMLSGQAEQRQNVSVEYKSNGQLTKCNFTVVPVIGQFYSNPKIAYSGETYKFNGNFTNLGLTVDVEYLINEKSIPNNIGENSIELKDIPASLEGQKLSFKRKYMGMYIGEPFIVEIKPPKPPVIISVKKQNDIIAITARGYGKTLEGRPNSPDQLFFMKGGNETSYTSGDTYFNNSENYSERTFQIRKKEGIQTIIQLKIKVIDKRQAANDPPREIDF